MNTIFDKVSLAPPDPILGLTAAFQKDVRKNKVNLGVGIYREKNLLTSLLHSVKLAEEEILKEETNKEYLPIEGDPLFLHLMGRLVFGDLFWKKESGRVASFQSVGGTGALSIGGIFLKPEMNSTLYIPTPTWPNHRGIFSSCGWGIGFYPYYEIEAHQLLIKDMLDYLETVPKRSVVVLHACCHNPTGRDPSLEEWKEICKICEEKELFPFFDFAYQGFGLGIEEDAAALRLFAEKGLEMCVAVSCAKNFSLYGERVGCLFIVNASGTVSKNVASRVSQLIRTRYSNPPLHGAKVVAHILGHPYLAEQWRKEVSRMRTRIDTMRLNFCNKLTASIKEMNFSHMYHAKGMFGFSGLNRFQVARLISEFGIYMTSDGRINVSGLNEENIDTVVDAIAEVVTSFDKCQ